MNIKRKASHVGVYGMSGTGKTSYVERYLIGSHHDRVFIYDHEGEFQERLHLIPIYDFSELTRRCQQERILCFDYSVKYQGLMEETFDEFCTQVFNLCKKHLEPVGIESLLVCDELQKVVEPHNIPMPMKIIMQTGRRFALDTIIMSQQPNDINNKVRVQHTELAIFKLQDDNALKFVKNVGMNVEEVMNQKDLHYIWRNTKTGEERRASIIHAK